MTVSDEVWKATAERLSNETIELRAEVNRLRAALEQRTTEPASGNHYDVTYDGEWVRMDFRDAAGNETVVSLGHRDFLVFVMTLRKVFTEAVSEDLERPKDG